MSEASLHRLPQKTITKLAQYGFVESYQDGELIHDRGDAKPGLSIVKSGRVRVGNYGQDGRYCLTRILTPSETFGEFTLFAHLPRTHNAQAMGQAEVIQLDEANFKQCCQLMPTIKDNLLTSLSTKLHESLEMIDDMRRLPLHMRVAKALVSHAKQTDTDLISIKQADLADLLGVSVLSAHHALKKLSEMQLIRVGYGSIEIVSTSALKTWLRDHASLLDVTQRQWE